MRLSPRLTRLTGQQLKKLMKLRGGGSALPGLVVEKLDPDFLARALHQLPQGVVVVSGTNGKTTTTKMVVQLLRAEGLKVFTNPSGSNFTRGVVASLIDAVDDETGRLDADIAVLELDEAHAVHFVRQVTPRFALILNVLRDQLDRFGEIDHTARLLAKVVSASTEGVVLNREDPLVRSLEADVSKQAKLHFFGLSPALKDRFPSDSDLRGAYTTQVSDKLPAPHRSDTILEKINGQRVTFAFGRKAQKPVELKLDGIYNLLNAAAALTLARMIRGDKADEARLLNELSEVRPAFGRGEAIEIDGQPLEIVLVKNPSGFRLAISSYLERPAATMIAINDNYADGRDMSWLWDVDFDSLRSKKNQAGVDMVSGVRAYDMALRLQYDNVLVGHVETSLEMALSQFLRETDGPRRIYCTYTAMLALRRTLSKTYELEAIG